MTLQEQFEKETGILFPSGSKCYCQEQLDMKIKYWYKSYSEWLEKRVPQWINVKDRLPDYDQIVLWWTDDGHILETDIPHDDDKDDIENFLRGKSLCGVRIPITHWMPMLNHPYSKRGTEAEP